MATYPTRKPLPIPQPEDTLHTYQDMAVDRPIVRKRPDLTWHLVRATRCAPTSNFYRYYFIAIEPPSRDEYSAEWLDALERAA